MTLVLLAVGLLATAVGFVTIGFGIPINAFSLGNTLIITGAIAVASGLILIGLASVLGALKRIADALNGKALPRVSRSTESVDASPRPVARAAPAIPPLDLQAPDQSRSPELPRAPEPPRVPEPRQPEPRFPATASEPAPAVPAGPLDWLRAKSSKPAAAPMPSVIAPSAVADPPMVELTDEAPLSPRSPQRPAMPPAIEPAQAVEPKAWSPSHATPLEPQPAPRAEPPMTRPEPPLTRSAPQVEPPKEKERFDLVWPDRGAAVPPPPPNSAPAPASEQKVEIKREPALDMPLPPIPARPRDNRPATEKRMPEILRKAAAEQRGPAILKSGVIDGMPYTLYADGSIEAQLPQGMVKFASVDALRAHLEKQG
jgi:hypothetical protein